MDIIVVITMMMMRKAAILLVMDQKRNYLCTLHTLFNCFMCASVSLSFFISQRSATKIYGNLMKIRTSKL